MVQILLIAKIFAVIANIVILSYDLGNEPSKLEESLYQNFLIQLLFVSSIAYLETENYIITGSIAIFWFIIKYVGNLSRFGTN